MDLVSNPEGFAVGMTAMNIFIAIVFAVALTIPLIFIGIAIARRWGKRSEVLQLTDTGEPATATIQHFRETGTVVDEQPIVNIVLLVFREGGGNPYQAEIKTQVSTVDIPGLAPGFSIPVRVDPNNPQRLALDLKAFRSLSIATPGQGSPTMDQQVGDVAPQQAQVATNGQPLGQQVTEPVATQLCTFCGYALPAGTSKCSFCGRLIT